LTTYFEGKKYKDFGGAEKTMPDGGEGRGLWSGLKKFSKKVSDQRDGGRTGSKKRGLALGMGRKTHKKKDPCVLGRKRERFRRTII